MTEQHHIHWTDKRSCTHKGKGYKPGQNYTITNEVHDVLKPLYSFEYVDAPAASTEELPELILDLRSPEGQEAFYRGVEEVISQRSGKVLLHILYPEEKEQQEEKGNPLKDVPENDDTEEVDTPPEGDVAGWSARDVLVHGDYKGRMKWLTHRDVKVSELPGREDASLIAYIEDNFLD